jgi:DNA-binding CsgD family transcriptional regulator
VNRCFHSPSSGVLPSLIAARPPGMATAGPGDFLTRLDERLRQRNERLLDQLLAWGELLDAAGWSVALEWGSGDFWLSDRARQDLQPLIEKNECWETLLTAIARVAGETLHRKSEGMLIWISPGRKQEPSALAEGLTRRENEIMTWLQQGKTSPEIAIILGCAPRTVDKHLANLYRKTGARNRTSVIFGTRESPI